MSSQSLDKGNKWVKENLESIDFVIILDQKGASFDVCMQQSWKFYIVMKSRRYFKMISCKGMDEFFQGTGSLKTFMIEMKDQRLQQK